MGPLEKVDFLKNSIWLSMYYKLRIGNFGLFQVDSCIVCTHLWWILAYTVIPSISV